MTWIALAALLRRLGSGLWSWLTSLSFWQLTTLGLACFAVVQHFTIAATRHERDSWQKQYTSIHTQLLADRQAYAKAQSDAAAQNQAHIIQIEQLQEKINEASRSSFTADRDRLRAQSGASKGPAGTAGVPQVPHAAPGTPPEVVSLPPAELLRAQELELQLNALIDWIEAQTKVDPNTEAAH